MGTILAFPYKLKSTKVKAVFNIRWDRRSFNFQTNLVEGYDDKYTDEDIDEEDCCCYFTYRQAVLPN